jgi:hypothetical protein
MSRLVCVIAFAVLLACPLLLFGFFQAGVLPRDPEKLMSRVQQYWSAVKAGKRATASQFVLAGDRDTYLNGDAATSIIKEVQIVGLDLTSDRNTAIVRTNVEESPKGMPDTIRLTVGDSWVWKDGNWFLTLSDTNKSAETVFKMASAEEVKRFQQEFESSLALENNVIDVGTLVRNGDQLFHVPVKYGGKASFSVESSSLVPFVSLRALDLPPSTKSLPLYVNSETAPDAFATSVPLRFWSGVAFVEKNLFVKGRIFYPLALRLPMGGVPPGKPISIYVKNNTDETAEIDSLLGDERYEMLSSLTTIAPKTEGQLLIEVHPDQKPVFLKVYLLKPLNGVKEFTLQFEPAR